jgi:hypothetical protein
VTYFTADRRWQGRTVACIASGPSLTREDCEAVRHLPAIAVNNAGLPPMAHWAEVHYAADGRWWQKHLEAMSYDRLKLACNGDTYGVQLIRTAGKYGFDDRPDVLRTGASSGYQAIHLAAHFGAKRIILLGYDGAPDGDRPHFHGSHTLNGLADPRSDNYETWRAAFRTLAPELEKRGVEVVNCSRRTAIDAFPCMNLEDALQC